MGGDTAKGLRFWVEGSRVSGVKLFLLFLWGMGVGVSWGAGKWGMVDTNGTWRLPEKYDEVGEFRGDLQKSFTLPEFLPGVKGAKVKKWLKAEGDEVKGGQALAQVELTEPALPVESPIAGMLVKIGVPKGGAAIPGSALGSVRNLGHVGMFEKKQFDVICPGYGPNPGSATVVRWLKEEGDAVMKGDKIAEVRPKEAMAMLQAPGSGTLVRIEVKEGEEAKVGQAVAKMGIGRVPVKLGGEWFYADERGTRVTQDRYQAVGSMLGGMAPVRLGEKWGFVDGEGRLIPKATDGKKAKGFSLGISEKSEYDEARKVRGGLAAVRLMDRWGYVAYQEGGIRMAIAPRFLQAKDFSEGLAAVEESEDAPVAELPWCWRRSWPWGWGGPGKWSPPPIFGPKGICLPTRGNLSPERRGRNQRVGGPRRSFGREECTADIRAGTVTEQGKVRRILKTAGGRVWLNFGMSMDSC